MTHPIARFFAISPGEENKTILLYSLHFFLFLGQSWGALAALTLFLDNWPAEDLAFMFIGSALFTLAVGLAYTSFADRISNLRLLFAIYAFIALWLISVRLLFFTNGGQYGLAYPYFYLLYDLVRDLSVLHMITYTNSFYNTRSAKRAMPFVLSAGLAGNTVAGFTVALIGGWIGLENIPLLWLFTLLIAVVLVIILERSYSPKSTASRPVSGASVQHRSKSWQNLKEGFGYVRGSAMLRWLALAAFGMVLLMNVLTLQSIEIFQDHYAGDREGMLRFFGIFAGFSNLFGVFVQSIWISRLIGAIGVGSASLIFPTITMSAVLAIGIVPTYLAAVHSRLTYITFRRAVQVPVDAILYNCLHPSIKGRARAFIHTMVIPMGALTGGLLLLAARQGLITTAQVSGGAVLIAVVYLIAMLRVRREYRLSFSQLLADGEVAFLRSGEDAFQHPDPNAIKALIEQLDASESAQTTIFLSEMLFELQGPSAFAKLQQVALDGGPAVQTELIRLLGEEWISHPTVRAMAVAGMKSRDVDVIIAAASVLAAAPESEQDEETLVLFLQQANAAEERVRVAVLPTLLRAADPDVEAAAHKAMAGWLAADANDRERLLAMRVLAQAGDESLLERLEPYAVDPSPGVRVQAVRLITSLAERTEDEEIEAAAVDQVTRFLLDDEESVQLAAIRHLATLQYPAAAPSLWPFLDDRRNGIRRAAVDAFPRAMQNELHAALDGGDPLRAESASVILSCVFGHRRFNSNILSGIEAWIGDILVLREHLAAVGKYMTPEGKLFQAALQGQIDASVDHIFWLIGALCSQEQALVIERSLHSPSEQTRANGAEALESLTTPLLSRELLPLAAPAYWPANPTPSGQSLDAIQILRYAWPELRDGDHAPASMSAQRANLMLFYGNDWLKAVAIHATLVEHGRKSGLDALLTDDQIIPDRILRQALEKTATAETAVIIESIDWAWQQLDARPGKSAETNMLSIIEKVLFLKDVQLFEDMNIDQLRVLAAISEEVEYGRGAHIARQGEHGDSLYVIVQGKAAVQSATRSGHRTTLRRLALLGPHEYFGEMSIFDNQPFGSDVVSTEPVLLLRIRQEAMLNLIELQPDLSLSMLRVFSQRLRHFIRIAEDNTDSKPKELMDVYDLIGS